MLGVRSHQNPGAQASQDLAGPDFGGDLHRLAFELAATGLAILSPDGRSIVSANTHLCSLLGHPPGALLDRPLTDLGEVAHPLPDGIRFWRRADGAALPRLGPRRTGC